jgi:alpha-tubulin suppressor-like RCC1 family protein
MRCCVRSCGWNGFGQLGIGNVEFQENVCQVDGLGDVEQVACGGHHYAGFSVVRDKEGRVFAWGDNSFGQLSFEGKKPCLAPRQIDLGGQKSAWIACGTQHVVVVLENGKVVSFGDNSFGQQVVSVEDKFVIAVSCGDAHTLLLTREGSVIAFGSDELGQTGGAGSLANVHQVACGQSYSLALLKDGSVFAFGCNAHAQLGSPKSDCVVRVPVRLNLDSRAVFVSAGNCHSLVLDEKGDVFGFGSNEYNQLGMQEVLMCCGPVRIPVKKATQIAAGGLHSLIITKKGEDDEGEVTVFGCQSEGQALYKGKAKQMAAAETHNLFLC